MQSLLTQSGAPPVESSRSADRGQALPESTLDCAREHAWHEKSLEQDEDIEIAVSTEKLHFCDPAPRERIRQSCRGDTPWSRAGDPPVSRMGAVLDTPRRRFEMTAELFELGAQLRESRYRRENPDTTDDEVRLFIRTWLRDKPLEAPGELVSLPRSS